MISERKLKNSPRSKVILNPARVMDWRRRKGLTMVKAAEFIGVAIQTYVNAESGRRLFLLTAEQFSRKLRIPLDELKETTN